MDDMQAREPTVVTISGYHEAREALRHRQLRQALYDEGDVVMADVLVNLHGDDHRARRRLENRLFRLDTTLRYEHELFPPIVESTLRPHVQAGHAELVSLSHQIMMNLAASTAGIDRPLGTPEETDRLYWFMMRFIEGATLAHYTGDREARRREVANALEDFDGEFLAPSIERRRELIARVDAGAIAESELPADVLTTLLRNLDDLQLPPDVVRRETCFYLLAGAHTSATAFVRTIDALIGSAPVGDGAIGCDREQRALSDTDYLQRCVHETVRLQPSSPVAMRWALDDVELRTGRRIERGARVVIDLIAANRDASVFGAGAELFDPDRELSADAPRWGLSFGSGMHACIGQELAAGTASGSGNDPDDAAPRQHGLIVAAVRSLLAAGVRPDPERPAVVDLDSARGYWSEYPVRLGGAP